MINFSILINSTDSFEDCWIPFFTLFKKYWPNYSGKIYLNTETKDFIFPGLDIICIKNNIDSPNVKITWSECLVRALNFIDSEIILYMQEDYFIKDFVKDELVNHYGILIENNYKIDCLHITDQGPPCGKISNIENLYFIPNKHKDRISCQAAFWRRDVLKEYLRPHESAWNFEWWGSKRASVFSHNFYVIDRNWVKLNSFEIIPYVFTAVIGGKWNKEVVTISTNNNLNINFSNRGFFEPNIKSFTIRIKLKIKGLPVAIKSYLDLLYSKFKTF